MLKPRLFTPGPTPVPEEALLELARPVTYHRTAEQKQVLAEVLADLKYVYQTANDVIVLTSSGTGGMEAAVSNVLAPGKKAILLTAGRWGERWRGVMKGFGTCSCGSVMLKPTDAAPTSCAPRFAASITPGPPPVAITQDLRRWSGEAVDTSRPNRRASS